LAEALHRLGGGSEGERGRVQKSGGQRMKGRGKKLKSWHLEKLKRGIGRAENIDENSKYGNMAT